MKFTKLYYIFLVIKMRLCEYMNNFVSLDVLFKHLTVGKIFEVEFSDLLSNDNLILFNLLNLSSFKFKVEKDINEPIFNILYVTYTDIGPIYKIYDVVITEKKYYEYISNYIKKYGKIPLVLEIDTGEYFKGRKNVEINEEYLVKSPKEITFGILE